MCVALRLLTCSPGNRLGERCRGQPLRLVSKTRSLGLREVATFAYDADGLLQQAGTLHIDRSAQHGLMTGTTIGAVKTTQTVDGFAELKQSRAFFGAQTLYEDQTTQRDTLGRLKSHTQTILDTSGATTTSTRHYSHDLVGRLTTVQSGGTSHVSYEYDANGNRTARIDAYGRVVGSYDAQDRLTLHCPRDAQAQPAPTTSRAAVLRVQLSRDGPAADTARSTHLADHDL